MRKTCEPLILKTLSYQKRKFEEVRKGEQKYLNQTKMITIWFLVVFLCSICELLLCIHERENAAAKSAGAHL